MLETLKQYEKDGWIRSQTHPTLDLTIYNYTEKTQYEQKWDDVTLKCRGLILNSNGVVVGSPFKKFFNIEEEKHVATDEFEIFEKMDGSLIICCYYKHQWVVASRGSFTSEHAKWAREIWDENRYGEGWEKWTLCFELVHPENRIVVDYGKQRELKLLGAFNEYGLECGYDMIDEYNSYIVDSGVKFNLVEKYDYTEYDKLKQLNTNNREGFVVKFSNGDRCKIKFEDYVNLHKIVTSLSTKGVWENLKNDTELDLTGVPDEIFDKIRSYQAELLGEFDEIEKKHIDHYLTMRCKNRKEFAEQAVEAGQNYKINSHILFKMLDNNSYSDIIWEMVKPDFFKL